MKFTSSNVLARIKRGPVRYSDLAGTRAHRVRVHLRPIIDALEAQNAIKGIHLDGVAHYAIADWELSDSEKLRLIEEKSRRLMDGCLEWTGYVDPRRGPMVRFGSDGSPIAVRRVVWGIKRGELDYQDTVRFRCENSACIELKHMKKGRREDPAKGRALNPAQRSRIAEGLRATRAKLDWDKVRTIRASSESDAVLAERYQVTKATISAVRRNETWQELGGMFTSLITGRTRA